MERIILDIALVIVAFMIGYWSGFRACFDYLQEELKKHIKDSR